MLEFALEKFPKTVTVKEGLEVCVRPLEKEDEKAFHDFHLAIPEDELLFIKHRITEEALFHEWCSELDYERNLPLLALVDGKIVGDVTLHQRQGGWKRHIGLVSALIHPDYRGRGILGALLAELVEIAKHCGLVKLESEFNGERATAMRALAEEGFRELTRIPKYVQDMHCKSHDYVLLGLDLIIPEEYTGAGD